MKCSKCGKDAKGHPKPLGEECTLDIESNSNDSVIVDMAASGQDYIDFAMENVNQVNQPANTDADKLSAAFSSNLTLQELSRQMAQVLASMESLSKGQAELYKTQAGLKKELSEKSTTPDYSLLKPSSQPQTFAIPAVNTHQQPAQIEQTHTLAANARTMAMSTAETSGEFVHLEDFLPTDPLPASSSELEPYVDSVTKAVAYRPKRARKAINSFEKWLQAWNNFERLLVNDDCQRYNSLADYREHIAAYSRKFHWPAVYAYDQRFRAALAVEHSFEYGKVNNDLYTTILDSTPERKDIRKCKRCRSTEHEVADCPFPTPSSAPLEEKGRQAGGKNGTTRAKRDATTSTLGNARTQAAPVPMCATAAGEASPSPPATTARPTLRLHPEAFREGLSNHPDQEFADSIVTACTQGVDIGYQGPRHLRIHDNWPSVYKNEL